MNDRNRRLITINTDFTMKPWDGHHHVCSQEPWLCGVYCTPVAWEPAGSPPRCAPYESARSPPHSVQCDAAAPSSVPCRPAKSFVHCVERELRHLKAVKADVMAITESNKPPQQRLDDINSFSGDPPSFGHSSPKAMDSIREQIACLKEALRMKSQQFSQMTQEQCDNRAVSKTAKSKISNIPKDTNGESDLSEMEMERRISRKGEINGLRNDSLSVRSKQRMNCQRVADSRRKSQMYYTPDKPVKSPNNNRRRSLFFVQPQQGDKEERVLRSRSPSILDSLSQKLVQIESKMGEIEQRQLEAAKTDSKSIDRRTQDKTLADESFANYRDIANTETIGVRSSPNGELERAWEPSFQKVIEDSTALHRNLSRKLEKLGGSTENTQPRSRKLEKLGGSTKMISMTGGDAQSQKDIQESRKMMKDADGNNDGQIDFEEFKKVWHQRHDDKYLHRLFSVFDHNGNGYIDAKELEKHDESTDTHQLSSVQANTENQEIVKLESQIQSQGVPIIKMRLLPKESNGLPEEDKNVQADITVIPNQGLSNGLLKESQQHFNQIQGSQRKFGSFFKQSIRSGDVERVPSMAQIPTKQTIETKQYRNSLERKRAMLFLLEKATGSESDS